MTREQTEKIISQALETIREIIKAYDPDFDNCTMYITPTTKSAVMLMDAGNDEVEYTLNLYESEDEA